MTVDEVVEAAEMYGRTQVSDCARGYPLFSPTWRIEVHRREVASSAHAVAAYVSQFDGLPLVGRDLSDLEKDLIAYAEAMDVHLRYTPEGYAGPNDPGVLLRGQLVGQVLRSRPLFMVTRDGANTEWDSIPL
ncbi:hypothetical protein AB0D45_00705 [Streptomyces sp. NPDC048352]|uniref:hypothetical protein n=1 Tax=Streptomyces sp. NPDC048352 TaxID=3154718 RepID=UPI003421C018